jgi:hypothetical protein
VFGQDINQAPPEHKYRALPLDHPEYFTAEQELMSILERLKIKMAPGK